MENSITYQLDNNVFIPYNTGVIVMDDICDDIYNDILDSNIMNAIRNNDFSNCRFFFDNFETKGKYSYDYSFLGEEVCTTFRFINIECRHDAFVVIAVSAGTPVKLWVNYKLFSVFGNKKRLCILFLKNGVNSLIMEVPETNKTNTFLLRISDYQIEIDPQNPDSILIDNMFPTSEFGYTKHSGNHLYNNENFEVAYYPDNDMHGLNETAEIEITDVFNNRLYFTQRFPVRKNKV